MKKFFKTLKSYCDYADKTRIVSESDLKDNLKDYPLFGAFMWWILSEFSEYEVSYVYQGLTYSSFEELANKVTEDPWSEVIKNRKAFINLDQKKEQL